VVRAVRGVVIALLALGASACGGYADLPVQVREQALLTVEAATLFPGAVGTVQVAIHAPDDVTDPLWLVGGPELLADDVSIRIVGWAYGACRAWTASAPGELEEAGMRLCLSVYTPPSVPPTGVYVGVVVDDRAQARRFAAISEVTAP
jgi:hypothetical protein